MSTRVEKIIPFSPAIFRIIKENPEIFFLFIAIVFIPLHFLIKINEPIYGDTAVYANLGICRANASKSCN